MVTARASRSRVKKITKKITTTFDFILSLSTLVMAPVQEERECSIWVIAQIFDNGETSLLEAHVSQESANVATKALRGIEVEVMELQLKSLIDLEAPPKDKRGRKTSSSSSSKSKKKIKDSDDEGDGEDDASESGTSEIKVDRRALPDLTNAKQNCLRGYKIRFTGTMERNRKVCEAAAIMQGAEIATSVKAADFVVLGTKPGPKKLEEIEEHNVDTLEEREFFAMLETGFPERKRKQSTDEESDDETPKKKNKK